MAHPFRGVAAAALGALVLGACGGGGDANEGSDNEYPAAAKTNFVNACVAQPGAKRSACECAFGRIQARLSFDEFQRADDAARQGRAMDKKARDVFADAVDQCRG